MSHLPRDRARVPTSLPLTERSAHQVRSERSSGVVCALLVVPFRPAFVRAHGIAAARGHEDVGRHLLHGMTAQRFPCGRPCALLIISRSPRRVFDPSSSVLSLYVRGDFRGSPKNQDVGYESVTKSSNGPREGHRSPAPKSQCPKVLLNALLRVDFAMAETAGAGAAFKDEGNTLFKVIMHGSRERVRRMASRARPKPSSSTTAHPLPPRQP